MKIPFSLYCMLAVLLLLAGCASHVKSDTRMVTVASCKASDKTGSTLIYDTLRQHGILAIGFGSGGWEAFNVGESQAAEARTILSELSTEGHSFEVIFK